MPLNSQNQLYGFPQPLTVPFPPPIISSREPTTSDFKYVLGQLWVDKVDENYYGLVNVTADSATWVLLASSSGDIATLTGDDSVAVSPSAGNIDLNGTSGQIVTASEANGIVWSLASAITAPGSLTTTTTLASGTTLTAGSTLTVTTNASVGGTLGVTGASTLAATTIVGTAHINVSGSAVTTIGTGGTGAVNIGNATGNTAVTGSLTASTTLTATLGAITATNGNLVLGTAGNKILSTSVASNTTAGANSFGTVTLVAGTATVATSAVTSSSLIVLWRQSVGSTGAAALGLLVAGTITSGTSFVINAVEAGTATSVQTSDVSVVGWMLIN